MLLYLAQVTVCLAFFYGLYYIGLRKETMFHTNRVYLMITLIISLILPFVKIYIEAHNTSSNVVIASTVYLGNYVNNFSANISTPEPKTIPWLKILTGLYLLGASVMSVRLLLAFKQILDIRKTGIHTKVLGHLCILSDKVKSPFSFFNTIYLPLQHSFSEVELNEVIAHEMAHVSGMHTWDVILMELLCIKLWPSPMIYLYRNSLKEVHEFVADAAVVKDTPWENYAQLLVSQQHSQLQNILSNQLIYSQLKKRLLMMNKERSGFASRYKYLGILPVLLIALLFFSFREKPLSDQEIVSLENQQKVDDEIVLFVSGDQRYFLGASEFAISEIVPKLKELTKGNTNPEVKIIIEDKSKTTVSELAEILDVGYSLNIRFIVDTNEEGKYDSYKAELLTSNSHYRIDTLPESTVIALRLTEPTQGQSIPEDYTKLDYTLGMPIFPGCNDVTIRDRGDCGMEKLGEYINAHMVYPESLTKSGKEGSVHVKFVLDANGYVKDVSIEQSLDPAADQAVLNLVNGMNANVGRWRPARKEGKSYDAEMVIPISFYGGNSTIKSEPLKIVDEMARFPGCEQMTNAEERNACAQEKMFHFVYSNISYPKEDRLNNIEGTGIVQFVIGVDGRMTDIEVLRSPGAGITAELFRLMNAMAALPERWIPAMKDGKAVPYQLVLPVKFKLQETEKEIKPDQVSDTAPYAFVEEMPRFNGCEDLTDISERNKCSTAKLYSFINNQIRYPSEDRDKKIEGHGIVQFVVEADGSLSNIHVLRSPSPTIAAEIMRMMKVMASTPGAWMPGKQDGVAVPVRFTLPVKFKLQDEQAENVEVPVLSPKTKETNSIKVTPNPAQDVISVSYFEGAYILKIFDTSGNLVLSQEIASGVTGEETISLSTLNPGQYVIQVISKNQTLSSAFVITR